MKNNINAMDIIDYSMKKALRDFDTFTTRELRTIIWHRVDGVISFAGKMALIDYETLMQLNKEWVKYYPA